MKPQSAKNKGRRFQQWIRDKVAELFNLDQGDVESRSMGASGTDLMLSPAARKVFPYAVEAKAVERLNVWESFKQAKANSTDELEPVLFIKRNRHDPLVVISADHFFTLIKRG